MDLGKFGPHHDKPKKDDIFHFTCTVTVEEPLSANVIFEREWFFQLAFGGFLDLINLNKWWVVEKSMVQKNLKNKCDLETCWISYKIHEYMM